MKIIIYANQKEWPAAIVTAHQLMDVASHTAVRDIKTHPDAVKENDDRITELNAIPEGHRFIRTASDDPNPYRVIKKYGKKPGIKCLNLWTGTKHMFSLDTEVINLEAGI